MIIDLTFKKIILKVFKLTLNGHLVYIRINAQVRTIKNLNFTCILIPDVLECIHLRYML